MSFLLFFLPLLTIRTQASIIHLLEIVFTREQVSEKHPLTVSRDSLIEEADLQAGDFLGGLAK